jgi:hypothetical protein
MCTLSRDHIFRLTVEPIALAFLTVGLLIPTFLYLLLPFQNIEQAIALGVDGLFTGTLCGTLAFIY